MLAGFRVEDFSLAWPNFEGRAVRWVDADAIQDAYGRESSGNGACLVGPDGLLALTLETQDNGALQLFVLLCVSIGRLGAVKRQESALMEVARILGATRVAFKTKRRGFDRLMSPKWVRSGDEFSRSV